MFRLNHWETLLYLKKWLENTDYIKKWSQHVWFNQQENIHDLIIF